MDKRTEYVEKLSAQMVDWDVQIDRLKDKAENATPPVTFEYAKLIASLRLKRDQAAIELQGIFVASVDQWEDLKAGIEQIWHETQKLLRDAVAKTPVSERMIRTGVAITLFWSTLSRFMLPAASRGSLPGCRKNPPS